MQRESLGTAESTEAPGRRGQNNPESGNRAGREQAEKACDGRKRVLRVGGDEAGPGAPAPATRMYSPRAAGRGVGVRTWKLARRQLCPRQPRAERRGQRGVRGGAGPERGRGRR
ncbi:unnamed protein product [Rangifer tarandus platyrhynchus]|uniref:Uncharacterized protein n=2 Tax=Rangifer tarandus platyrhynchus TaxID=3082113 RepID=A0ACB0FGH9_RANTA|nr:unnamed protein product [Rangifer tarandus platyrhynchus]CAI9711126.1 unnamed protein product [Rangifer tarandus platyrhynchus]